MSKRLVIDDFDNRYKERLIAKHGYDESMAKIICETAKNIASFYGVEYLNEICDILETKKIEVSTDLDDYSLMDSTLRSGIEKVHINSFKSSDNRGYTLEEGLNKHVYNKIMEELVSPEFGTDYTFNPTLEELIVANLFEHDEFGEVLREYIITKDRSKLEEYNELVSIDRLIELTDNLDSPNFEEVSFEILEMLKPKKKAKAI